MRRFSKFIFVVFTLLTVSMNSFASEEFTNLIVDKKQWKKFNWGTADKSALWTTPGWLALEDDSRGPYFLKVREIVFSGISMKGFTQKMPSGRFERLLLTTDEERIDSCLPIENGLLSYFGKADRAVDSGYEFDMAAKGNTWVVIKNNKQWDLGTTRIDYSCFGMFAKNDNKASLTASVIFTEKSGVIPLSPLQGIKCSGLNTETKVNLIEYFIIDDNDGKLLLQNKRPMPGTNKVDKDSAFATTKLGEVQLSVVIDRITGTFKKTTTLRQAKSELNGSCEKWHFGERKF